MLKGSSSNIPFDTTNLKPQQENQINKRHTQKPEEIQNCLCTDRKTNSTPLVLIVYYKQWVNVQLFKAADLDIRLKSLGIFDKPNNL